MTTGTLLAVLLAVAAVAFVVAPLFRRDSTEDRAAVANTELQELHSRHDMALAGLKDLEDDRQTGKIDDSDYDELKAKLTAQAVEAMKQLDAHARTHPSIARRRQADHP